MTDHAIVTDSNDAWERALVAAALLVCALLLAAKFALARTINVNWDEFYFLSHVHSLVRGDLTLVLQGAYTHLFRWLPAVGADEMDRIVAARMLMGALLVATAALVYALARRWASRGAALAALVAFLGCWPVLRHGASFRADTLLAPLSVAVLVLWTRPFATRRDALYAGTLCGLGFAITAKAVLLAPVIVALELARVCAVAGDLRDRALALARRCVNFGFAAGATAGVALGLHRLSLGDVPRGPFATPTDQIVRKTLLEVPWFEQAHYFDAMLSANVLLWTLLALGVVLAARRRAWGAVALVLALAPIAYYRNAFPYYYVVMLAPAVVLVAVAVDGLRAFAARARWRPAPAAACLALVAVLAAHAYDDARYLARDRQAAQRALVAGVHSMFPVPVPYVDHSGMIASFPKTNAFLSGWSLENHAAAGRSFMAEALAGSAPPLLLANRPLLQPGTLPFRRLGAQDRELIGRYVEYWGPVRVAGADVSLDGSGPAVARLPIPGRYRVVASVPVRVGTAVAAPGEVVDLPAGEVAVEAAPGVAAPGGTLRLVWAAVRPPPAGPPPAVGDVYENL